MEIYEHLFRREAGRLVATLVRIFGTHNQSLAEDVMQDAFCRALEMWPYSGVPDNPSAWLMATARNRALDVIRRERTARTFAPELSWLLESEWTVAMTVAQQFEPAAIRDEQLRMMFACCHPRLPEETQVALILHVLCGFSVDEIAGAFLAGRAAIEKRISRGKKTLAGVKRLSDIGNIQEVTSRLPGVQRALYLLFNEGYHGTSADSSVRAELCREAMRLVGALRDHGPSTTPATNALAALMALHAARLPSRVGPSGELRSLFDQDRSRWDADLIDEGRKLFELSASGPVLTEYHLESAIAWAHTSATSAEATNLKMIVALYDQLLALRPSPVIALNRAIALSRVEGAIRGLEEINRIDDVSRLSNYPFYHAASGELELQCGRREFARKHFGAAQKVARSLSEREFFERRADDCIH